MFDTVELIRRARIGHVRRYSRYAGRLLEFFAEHRIALASQVQRRFADVLPLDRTARLHLQTLVANGDLSVLRQHGLGQPNVYQVTKQGLRRGEAVTNDGSPRRRRPTGSHLIHELLITEVATAVVAATRNRPDVSIPWELRFGLCKVAVFRGLVPDYAFLIAHQRGLIACLAEISSGEESPTRLGQKLERYADWAASPEASQFLIDLYRRHGAHSPRPRFRLLVIAQNRRTGNDEVRLRQVLRECAGLERSMVARVWVTTAQRLTQADSIDARVWTRGEDAVTHLTEWDMVAVKERRDRLTRLVATLPAQRLFPAMEEQSHVAPQQN